MVMFVLSVSMELLILKNWDRFPLKEKGRKEKEKQVSQIAIKAVSRQKSSCEKKNK